MHELTACAITESPSRCDSVQLIILLLTRAQIYMDVRPPLLVHRIRWGKISSLLDGRSVKESNLCLLLLLEWFTFVWITAEIIIETLRNLFNRF